MKEGVIIEVSENKLKVITPEGEFLEIKNNHEFNQIGDLIYIEPHMLNGIPRTLSKRKKTAIKTILAMAASLLLVFSILPLIIGNSKVYAYVSLDMDSGVELSVSEEMKVLDIQGIDQEGKEMLADLEEWENQDLNIVVSKILSLLHKEGKIQDEKEIVFSTVVLDQDKSLEQNLEKKLTNVHATERSSLKIETQKASMDDRQNAKEKGLSTGAYLDVQIQEDTAKKENRNQSTSKIEDENKDNLIKEEVEVPIEENKKPSVPLEPAHSKEHSEKKNNQTTSSPSTSQMKNSSNESKLNKKDELKRPVSEMRKYNSDVTDKKHRQQTKKPSNEGKTINRESDSKHSIKRNDNKSKKSQKEKRDNPNKKNDSRKKNEQKKEKRNISEQKHKGQKDNENRQR